LILLLPILALAAVAIAVLSRRSPLVAHLRIGQYGTPFWTLKVRTMWPSVKHGGFRFEFMEHIIDDCGSSQPPAAEKPKLYHPGDDVLMTLPTDRSLDPGGIYVNFSHRFAFDPAFSGPARGNALLGLDGYSLSSFGLRYGVSKDFSVSVYRSPTTIGRPVQLTAAYNFLSESSTTPLNAVIRFSVEGQNDLERNFAESFELILSRSWGRRAQIYFVPTVSFNTRHLFSPNSLSSEIPALPGYNIFSTGFGCRSRCAADHRIGSGSDPDPDEWQAPRNPPSSLFLRHPKEAFSSCFYVRFHKLTRDHCVAADDHPRRVFGRSVRG
jgi:hypothetical protein